jgi:hypothetical protein
MSTPPLGSIAFADAALIAAIEKARECVKESTDARPNQPNQLLAHQKLEIIALRLLEVKILFSQL